MRCFTGQRSDSYRVKPPLADLAVMQIELYLRLSRLDQIETLAGSPMLVGKGFTPPIATQQTDAQGRVIGVPAPLAQAVCDERGDRSEQPHWPRNYSKPQNLNAVIA